MPQEEGGRRELRCSQMWVRRDRGQGGLLSFGRTTDLVWASSLVHLICSCSGLRPPPLPAEVFQLPCSLLLGDLMQGEL